MSLENIALHSPLKVHYSISGGLYNEIINNFIYENYSMGALITTYGIRCDLGRIYRIKNISGTYKNSGTVTIKFSSSNIADPETIVGLGNDQTLPPSGSAIPFDIDLSPELDIRWIEFTSDAGSGVGTDTIQELQIYAEAITGLQLRDFDSGNYLATINLDSFKIGDIYFPTKHVKIKNMTGKEIKELYVVDNEDSILATHDYGLEFSLDGETWKRSPSLANHADKISNHLNRIGINNTELYKDAVDNSLVHVAGTDLESGHDVPSDISADDITSAIRYDDATSDPDERWVSVDLEEAKTIARVSVYIPSTHYATEIQIEASNNETVWDSVETDWAVTPQGQWHTIDLPTDQTYRYWRVKSTAGVGDTSGVWGIAEWELYEKEEIFEEILQGTPVVHGEFSPGFYLRYNPPTNAVIGENLLTFRFVPFAEETV